MKSWINTIFSHLIGQVAYQYAIRQLEKRMILILLKTLRVMRKSLLATVFVFIALQMMSLGFVGLLVTSIWIYPTDDLQTKLILLMMAFGILFLIPLTALCIFFSEKNWLKIADRIHFT
ncbi:MAG: hypothetical protein A2622_09275 [Bdellovibrionales bacterium RIFCSPHIGHO2_01_FULL_40_29]|nr:MAG: hypothetical protein A2622_09275 [Bdellovibrionales bacterium RIFCSPHIGHO2_01_FULL_40_29]OFZ33584.1 MAG: hypothetical protein A3D17_00350 [Bdellovibrionales bacterium RIFCSPHIGHO2_02_FULL_40_15]